MKTINIKHCGYIRKVRLLLDDWTPWGKHYLLLDETGPLMLVKATSWDEAFDAILDALPSIEPDDLPDAYGLNNLDELEQADPNDLDLDYGYYYQPNSGGTTGIVNLGHYWTMEEYDHKAEKKITN
jgi:hypothetical protein